MPTKTIDIHDAQSQLHELLSLVREGTEIILVEGDTPFARISPVEPDRRIPDLHPGGWMSDDFADPLPDDFWQNEP